MKKTFNVCLNIWNSNTFSSSRQMTKSAFSTSSISYHRGSLWRMFKIKLILLFHYSLNLIRRWKPSYQLNRPFGVQMESWLPWLHPAVIVSVGLQLQRNKTLSRDGFNKWGRNYLIGPQLRSRRLLAVAQNPAMARPAMLFFSSRGHNVPVRAPSIISPPRTGERDTEWLQPCLFE